MTVENEDTLRARLMPIASMPELRGRGLYLLVLRPGSDLPGVRAGADGVLYVGMTEVSLSVRNHFLHAHSGGSTLRRSLGALLREQLSLQPIPRDTKPANADKFRFRDADERRLSSWMEANLLGAQAEVYGDLRRHETDLIVALEPVLNLTKWRNPQKPFISAARRWCKDAVGAAFATA